MTKTKPMTDEWQTIFLNAGTEKGLGDLSMMIGVVSEIITQATSKAREEERNKLRQSVELWMDTHERNQTTFTTDNFIKFVTEEL